MIESVDSLRLLGMIDSEAGRQQKIIDCLLQVHIATEETKTGFSIKEIEETDWTTVAGSLSWVQDMRPDGYSIIHRRHRPGAFGIQIPCPVVS